MHGSLSGSHSRSIPRFLVGFGVVAAVVGLSWTAGRAPAQAQGPGVSMSLVSETAWNSLARPLKIAVSVTNRSPTPLRNLALVLTIEARASARSVYQLSVRQDATAVLHSFVFTKPGAVRPDAPRIFSIRQSLKRLALVSDNGIYPLQIQLLSGETLMATLRTPMVFLVETPETPLHLTWTWVLDEPLQLDPEGVLTPGPIEADIAPGGRLDAMVNAIDGVTPGPIDLVVSPVLVDELDRMSGGYRTMDPGGRIRTVAPGTGGSASAAHLLGLLRRIVGRPGTELAAMPFGDSRVPTLRASGLGDDLPDLVGRGRRVVASILGAQPSTRVFHPPFSQIDGAGANAMDALGRSVLLLGGGAVPVRAGLTPNPPPVVRLNGVHRSVMAVVPDPEVVSVPQPFASDPVLQAQVALGELAAVWLEFPGTPGRGISMVLGEGPGYPTQTLGAFAALVRASPWLRTVTASNLTSLIRSPGRANLARRVYPRLAPTLVDRLLQVRQRLQLFEATARKADGLMARLRSNLLLAETGWSVPRADVGLSFADWVDRQIASAYRRVLAPQTRFTLTSQRGAILLTVRNGNDYPLQVDVRFVADRRVQFPKGPVRELKLPANGAARFFVDVRATTTGRFPIKLQVFTPGDFCTTCLIAESEVIVRSTAYNRWALVVTIGAALFLLGRWGRRFLLRRKT